MAGTTARRGYGEFRLSAYSEPAWDARVLAEGAVASDGDNNVILLLERTGEEQGKAAAVQVEYSAYGIDYRVHGSMRITMVDSCHDLDGDF